MKKKLYKFKCVNSNIGRKKIKEFYNATCYKSVMVKRPAKKYVTWKNNFLLHLCSKKVELHLTFILLGTHNILQFISETNQRRKETLLR